ncbi:hypothetical protein H6800_02385 [Candidatus Nomurabacteria bacterium]|nr:hypothetical protein [Candidatus Nomurabacteria bacterium]
MSYEANLFAVAEDCVCDSDLQSDLDVAEAEWVIIKAGEDRREALERLGYKLWTRLQNISEV